MYEYCKESDWKLFKKLVPGWQERYMDKLNKKYIEILSRDKNPSENFWEIEKRIFKDKKHIGVVINMRRSTMMDNLMIMLRENVITIDDLDEFSDELKEIINIYRGV